MNPLGHWSYLLAMLGALFALGFLIYVAWSSLFADRGYVRGKPRRRCPQCWYDLAYSPGMTCAECGFTARRERDLYKTHRRYGRAVFAIAGCVAIAVTMNEVLMRNSWTAALPARVLLALMPIAPGANSAIAQELTNRAAMKQLSSSEWLALANRCATGDWFARPTSDAWIAKYGNIISQWRTGIAGDARISALLNSIPPRVDVTTRESWPTGTPVVVQVQVQDWWEWGMECRIRAKLHDSDDAPTTFYRTGDDRIPRRSFPLTVALNNSAQGEYAIDFGIDRRPMRRADFIADDPANPWVPAGSHIARFKTVISEAADAELKPIDSPSMTTTIASVFSAGVVKWESGASPVRVHIDLPATEKSEFDDVAIGLNVDLLHDDVLARSLKLWWRAGTKTIEPRYGFEVAYENADLLRTISQNRGQWQMRINGDRDLALRANGGKSYWAGEVYLPVQVDSHTGEAPSRAWWRGD